MVFVAGVPVKVWDIPQIPKILGFNVVGECPGSLHSAHTRYRVQKSYVSTNNLPLQACRVDAAGAVPSISISSEIVVA